MKNYLFFLIIFFSNSSYATIVNNNNDYINFYLSYPNRLFNAASPVEFESIIEASEEDLARNKPEDIMPNEDNILRAWKGTVNGKKQNIQIRKNSIIIGNQKILWDILRIFPKKSTSDDDFSDLLPQYDPDLKPYFNGSYICFEKTYPSSVGVQSFFVYLIKLDQPNPPKIYLLPSLLNSCLNIRIEQDKSLSFFKLDYWYLPGKYKSLDPDAAQIPQHQGVSFTEYRLKDDEFEKTGKQLYAKFPKPSDVYHFSMIKALPKDAIVGE